MISSSLFAARLLQGNPLSNNLVDEAPVGLLGIELSTRRRNRMNGIARRLADGDFSVDVIQSFGNCPKFIQTRTGRFHRDPDEAVTLETVALHALDDAGVRVIREADTFFVASHTR